MNRAFLDVIAATDDERRDLFLRTARRLGTSVQNIEKDFWVCWMLDVLFNGLPSGGPRLLFKGGTSLSKAYGLIDRFSEDIDVTVFREDLGQSAAVEELEALSRKKRQARLDAIRQSCQAYICDGLFKELGRVVERTMLEAGMPVGRARLVLDDADPDQQTLLFWYPSSIAESDGYIRPAVKIESGAKSALDPHRAAVVTPYVASELPDLDLGVLNVTTIDPCRTFWDKVVILHGLRRWFDRRGMLRQEGQRISRHYYDIHCVLDTDVGRAALADLAMGAECVRYARLFFDRPDFDLVTAVPGTFALLPTDEMLEPLHRDYEQMSGMIFNNDVPIFDDVIASVATLEAKVNAVA